MNKTIIVSVIVALALGLLAVVLLFDNKDLDDATKVSEADLATTTTKEVAVQVPHKGIDSLQSLLALGQNLECTISFKQENVSMEGTYFTSLGRMRGDFITVTNDSKMLSSMIMDNGVMFSWVEIEGEKYGMKMDFPKMELPDAKVIATNEAVPLSTLVAYDCKPWLQVDSSVFAEPNDVVFSDYSNMMEKGMEYGTIYDETKKPDCSACESLPAEGKKQCLAALSCT